jgi:hypothetical protein
MNKKNIAFFAIIVLVLLFSVFGTVAAQADGSQQPQATVTDTPTVEPTEPTEPTETPVVNYDHPIVVLLDAYFGSLFPDPSPTPTETPVTTETPVVTETPVPTPDTGLTTVGEQIATYHADGMGFGVLVKLYAMAAESNAACTGDAACTPVTVEELVTAFDSGTGIGELMKEYGRPSLLGVGHVRNALEEQNPGLGNGPQKENGKSGDKEKGGKKK